MIEDQRGGLLAYRFATLPSERLDAFVSTRIGGSSTGPYASLNLGLRVEDDPAVVLANRRRLFVTFGLDLKTSVWCKQVHRESVHIVSEGDLGRGSESEEDIVDETDALVTDIPGVALCVTLADCVPVVIYDERNHVIGLAHAGWGGTVRRISSRTVEMMRERWGSNPSELVAAIGPSIAAADYEVGSEVIEAAKRSYGEDSERIMCSSGKDGKAMFDLWEANALDLTRAGVPRARIEVAGISTAAALDRFYSHRLEGRPQTGRFIAAAMLR
jgi:YfiH family protein